MMPSVGTHQPNTQAPGHVFVVRGDLMKLHADAWCVPGSHQPARPGDTWVHAVGDRPETPIEPGFGHSGNRVARWRPLRSDDPTPWLVDLYGSRGTPIDWYLDAVREFLEKASTELEQRTPRFGRARPLVTLPLVGTGQGGKRRQAGEMARALLPMLYQFCSERPIDIGVVMIDGAAYSAVQAVRRALSPSVAWRALDPSLIEPADRLARLAARRALVAFVGAGVSRGAGIPGWGELLKAIAVEEACLPDAQVEALEQLEKIDQALFLQVKLRSRERLKRAVARYVSSRSRRYSLGHAMLASLPVQEVVTTNYDELFETASASARRPVARLPYETVRDGERWLLKLHGCVSQSNDIVLTRDDYYAYRDRREALAGIVQAMLITRHMLFVGFSLEDDNFHRIIRAVRRAMHRGEVSEGKFGTTLVVGGNPLVEALWQDELDWVDLDLAQRNLSAATRRLEVFLDRVAAGAETPTDHLFHPAYDGVLSSGERRLRDLLYELTEKATSDERQTAAWGEVERLLNRLGWNERGSRGS